MKQLKPLEFTLQEMRDLLEARDALADETLEDDERRRRGRRRYALP